MFQATRAVSQPSGLWPRAGQPAATGSPTGARRACRGGPAYRAACVDWHRETMLVLGWALDEVQYKAT